MTLPNVPRPHQGNFAWQSDVGQNSVANLTALVRSAGQPFAISSGLRTGSNAVTVNGTLSYHGLGNAIDVTGSPDAMLAIAAYLYQYSPFLLELEHADSRAPGGGYFVKNGERVPISFYGTDGANHKNHIHVASTNSALQAAIASTHALSGKPGSTDRLGDDSVDATGVIPEMPVTQNAQESGCMSVIMAVLSFGGLLDLLYHLVR